MPGFTRRTMFGAVAAAGAHALTSAALSRVAQAAPAPSNVLWFDEPATLWQEHAFPIGNWYEERPTALAEVRRTIEETGSADTLSSMRKLGQTKWGYGAYQPFGDLHLDRPTQAGAVTGYRRDLDMATGLASVGYTADGITHRREFFASYPDRVIVTRLSADRRGQVSFTARFATADNGTSTTSASGSRMPLRGTLTHNGMVFEAQCQVNATGGAVVTNADGTVTVAGADEAVLVLALGTDYANAYPYYRGADPHDNVTATLNAVRHRGWDSLRQRHVTDHSGLFGRARIDLGQQPGTLPTDEALSEFKKARNAAKVPADPQLAVLHFQIGRYC